LTLSLSLSCPARYQSRRGGFKRPPRKVRAVFTCPECGTLLERGETGWVCPKAMHGRIVPDAVLLDRLYDAVIRAGYRRYTAQGIFRRQKRVQFWMRRMG
jgi:hypothetical protein